MTIYGICTPLKPLLVVLWHCKGLEEAKPENRSLVMGWGKEKSEVAVRKEHYYCLLFPRNVAFSFHSLIKEYKQRSRS